LEEDIMRKLGYVVAALGALAIVAPTVASAETMVIRNHHYGPYGARAEFREHRDFGWHRGWRHHGDKVVVIKRSHRHYDY
jgi:hypothetical protein